MVKELIISYEEKRERVATPVTFSHAFQYFSLVLSRKYYPSMAAPHSLT